MYTTAVQRNRGLSSRFYPQICDNLKDAMVINSDIVDHMRAQGVDPRASAIYKLRMLTVKEMDAGVSLDGVRYVGMSVNGHLLPEGISASIFEWGEVRHAVLNTPMYHGYLNGKTPDIRMVFAYEEKLNPSDNLSSNVKSGVSFHDMIADFKKPSKANPTPTPVNQADISLNTDDIMQRLQKAMSDSKGIGSKEELVKHIAKALPEAEVIFVDPSNGYERTRKQIEEEYARVLQLEGQELQEEVEKTMQNIYPERAESYPDSKANITECKAASYEEKREYICVTDKEHGKYIPKGNARLMTQEEAATCADFLRFWSEEPVSVYKLLSKEEIQQLGEDEVAFKQADADYRFVCMNLDSAEPTLQFKDSGPTRAHTVMSLCVELKSTQIPSNYWLFNKVDL
jgi:hypothetical protein